MFLGIPKTGTTAILNGFKHLAAQISWHNDFNNLASPGWLKCPLQHMCFELLNANIDVNSFDYIFGVVRNPEKRLISEYKFQIRNAQSISEIAKFDDWFEKIMREYRKNQYAHDNHITPQSSFVGPVSTKIFKYEEGLDSIFTNVLSDLGFTNKKRRFVFFNKKVKLERVNVGTLPFDVKAEISEHTRQRLRSFYSKDYDLWYNND